MKKNYNRPKIELFPTKCHISTLSLDAPEEVALSRRNLLMRVGVMATVGHISLYGNNNSETGPTSNSPTVLDTWNGKQ